MKIRYEEIIEIEDEDLEEMADIVEEEETTIYYACSYIIANDYPLLKNAFMYSPTMSDKLEREVSKILLNRELKRNRE